MKNLLLNIYTTAKIPHAGGMSTHIQGIVSQLISQNIDYRLYASPGKLYVKSGGAKSHNPLVYFSYSILKIIKCFLFYGKAEGRFNIYHDWFAIIGTRKSRNSRNILYVHGELVNELLALGTLRKSSLWLKVFRWIESLALRKADIIICVDDRLQKYVANEHKITAISKPNFVTPPSIVRLPVAPVDSINIVISRRFVEKNGIYFGLKAITLLKDMIGAEYKIRVDIFGSGQLYGSLSNEFKNDYMFFHGDVSSETVRDYLRRSHFCLVPSVPVDDYVEATSISALEALAEGSLLIASEIGGLKQLFSGNNTAALVQPGNSWEITRVMEYCIRNPDYYMTIARNGQNFILSQHSSASYLNNFLLNI